MQSTPEEHCPNPRTIRVKRGWPESRDVRTRKRCKDPRLDEGETGRDRREPREPQGKGGVTHDQQDRASATKMQRYEDHGSGNEPEEEDWEEGWIMEKAREKGKGGYGGRGLSFK